MQILIAEDEKNVRLLLKELMEPFSDSIIECPDGSEAVTRYAEHRPDLVLMDIRMPVMDGLEATERIMKMDRTARVLIVTEYNQAQYRERARRLGVAGYFLKDNLLELQKHVRGLER
jgi:CheY-like chemotaxis protein